MHTIGHLLTPGTPAYGVLRIAAVGAMFAIAARGRKKPPS